MVTISEIRSTNPDNSLDGDELLVTDKSLGGTTKSPKLGNSSVGAAGSSVTEYVKDYIEKEGLQNIDINANSIGVSSLNTTTTGNHTGTLNSKAISLVPFNNQANTFSAAQTFNAGIIATTGQFSDIVNSNSGFTINGTPVGTSTDTYWVAEGDGGISYGDYIDPSEIKTAQLQAIDKIVASSATIVDVFIYDTSKDSDGGAWRDRCEHLSWYQEFVTGGTTATRGSKAKFPAKALIVATTTTVTIYDLDKPEVPMWMVFNVGGSWISTDYMLGVASTIRSGIFSVNSTLYVTSSNGYGIFIVNFLTDISFQIAATDYSKYKGNIAQRNSGLSRQVAYSSARIVNSNVNDGTAKVLSNAPIDEITGLPIATVAVATEGGVSLITPTGTVYDHVINNATYSKVYYVNFDSDDNLWFGTGSNKASWLLYIFDEMLTADNSIGYTTKTGSTLNAKCMFGANPGVGGDLLINREYKMSYYTNKAMGLTEGFLFHDVVIDSPASSLFCKVTTTCNTGWMPGAIKGAWLSSNVAENIAGTELVTNGDFASDINGWSVQGNSTLSWYDDSGNGVMLVETGAQTYSGTQKAISGLTIGRSYKLQAKFKAGTYNAFNLLAGISGIHIGGSVSAATPGWQTATYFFTATATSHTLVLQTDHQSTTSGLTYYIDDVSLIAVDADRSVNNKGLTVNGTITKSAVATGAELMAYSGFSTSNYLEQAYNSDLDFGTGDFMLSCWFKKSAISRGYMLWRPESSSGVSDFFLLRVNDTTGDVTGSCGPTTHDIVASGINACDNIWHLATFIRKSGTIRLYIDGVERGTPRANTRNLLGVSQSLIVGNGEALNRPMSNIALAKISAYAPTADQIKQMYEDEKYLFQENAKCCLSKSNTIQDLSFDEDTEKLYVATADGTDVFSGLTRVEYIDLAGTPTNDNVKAVSAVNGAYALGTGAEAVVNEPAKNIREELATITNLKKPIEGVDAMTNVTAPANFDADTVTTAELADIVGNLINKLQLKGVVTQ